MCQQSPTCARIPATASIAQRACTRSDSANHFRLSGLLPRPLQVRKHIHTAPEIGQQNMGMLLNLSTGSCKTQIPSGHEHYAKVTVMSYRPCKKSM